jgi:hypothetical protein
MGSEPLMLNSTAVGTGCRAIIADRRIARVTAGPAASTPGCGLTSTGPVPDSYDFFAELPCLAGIDTATAALLSAQFPYVTPSGVVNGSSWSCRVSSRPWPHRSAGSCPRPAGPR